MPSLITEQSVKIIKATAPVVAEHIVEITTRFYANLLSRHPELYNYFNETNQRTERQPQAFSQALVGSGLEQVAGGALPPCLEKALFNAPSSSSSTPPPKGKFPGQAKTLGDAVVAYAQNIEQLDQLSEAVVRITHKHCALGVKPEHYLLVHDTLLEAVGQVLGAAITEEVAGAWSEAVMALAKLLIQMESDLYQEAAQTQWTGPRDFVITDILQETADIKSIRMVPADGKEVCPYRPGQYVSVYEKPVSKEYFAPRHYTLTSSFGRDAYYQITVKKQQDPSNPNESTLDGIMSHHLHSVQVNDTIKLGPIFGPDTLKQGDKENRVAAFVSVGVGITPTMSLLPTALQERPQGVAVFHGDLNSSTHAFGTTLRQMVTNGDAGLRDDHSSKNQKIRILSSSYSQPTEDDKSLEDYSEGRLTAQKIVEQLQNADIDFVNGVDYYICAGPTTAPLLVQELRALRVNQACLHLEFFGPFISV